MNTLKPFVISFVAFNGGGINDAVVTQKHLHYAYSRIEAIEFAKQFYQHHDVLAEDVDNYKASVVLNLEKV